MSAPLDICTLADAYTVISTNTVEPKPKDDGSEEEGNDSLLVIDSDAALAAVAKASGESHASLLSLSPDVTQLRINSQDQFRALVPTTLRVVNQTARWMYHDYGNQALRIFKNTTLQRVHWVEIFSTCNHTNRDETRVVESVSSLTLSNGQEADLVLGISASYRGLGVSFGAGHRTFQARETTETVTVTHEYTIPAGESLFLYQRHYDFEDVFWWVLDAWAQDWTVGVLNGHTPLTSSTRITISADEYMSRNTPVINQEARVDVRGFSPEVLTSHFLVRQFQNTTARAQRDINDIRPGIERRS